LTGSGPSPYRGAANLEEGTTMGGWKRIALAGVFLLSACGGNGGGYPQELVDQFMASCTAGGTSEAVCQCALDKIEAKYSLEEFEAESVNLAGGQASEAFTSDLVAFSLECAAEEGGA
jgi:hypothetical protein